MAQTSKPNIKLPKESYKLVPINKLVPHDKNPNTHSAEQVERLAKIINELGFRHPIIVSNLSGKIVSGHGRLEALNHLGWTKIPVQYQDFKDEVEEYQVLVSDNAIADWSMLDLKRINLDFLDLGPFDVELLGLKDFEINPLDKVEPQCDEDEVPEKVPAVSVLGDVYELGRHRLMCGDSTSIDAVEKLMEGEKADMFFTDPPYGVDYEGINNDSRSGLSQLLSDSFDNYLMAMKEGSCIYVFHSDKCADIFHNEFRKRFHFSNINIWVKPSLVMGQSDYQSRHEPIIYGWKEGDSHKWFSDRKQTSIWEFGREKVQGHTTPKPVDLIAYAITNSSKDRSSILDLFGGSGSTLIACEKTDRKCFMMELDPHYVDVIVSRWCKYTGQTNIKRNGEPITWKLNG